MSGFSDKEPDVAVHGWLFDDETGGPVREGSQDSSRPTFRDCTIQLDDDGPYSRVICLLCEGRVKKSDAIVGGIHVVNYINRDGHVRAAVVLCTCRLGRYLKTTRAFKRHRFWTELPTYLVDPGVKTKQEFRESVREKTKALEKSGRRLPPNPLAKADPDFHREEDT